MFDQICNNRPCAARNQILKRADISISSHIYFATAVQINHKIVLRRTSYVLVTFALLIIDIVVNEIPSMVEKYCTALIGSQSLINLSAD
jgi:hypothetical protein